MISLNSNNFDKEVISSNTKVLVDFNADWCGPCRMMAPILESLSESRTDVKFASLNIDDEDELASKYNVSSIPCLVLFENGKEVKRSVGLIPADAIEEFLGE